MWGRSSARLRTPACHAGDRGFKSHRPRKFFMWPFKKKKIENLSEVLEKIEGIEKRIENLEGKIEETKKEQQFFIKKVGIFKFNALKNLGGNQSFALALLDEKDNGVVISNLVLRQESRMFVKLIKNGLSENLLTEEERKAIEISKNGKEQFYNDNKKTTSNYYFRTH